MNREIKFRALDKITQKMTEVICLNLGSVNDVILRCLETKNIYNQLFDNIELKQSTGIKDVNNEEIFEKDDCKIWCDSFSEKLGQCKNDWCGTVEYCNKSASFIVKTMNGLVFRFNDTDFNGKSYKFKIIKKSI